jgi:hypothetical protein
MALPGIRRLLVPERTAGPEVRYGVILRMVPGDQTEEVEIERAPDSGGSPGSYAAVATVGPFPKSGGFYVDYRPKDGATWWYRARHAAGYNYANPGAYFTAVSAIARRITNADIAAQIRSTSPFTRTEDIKDSAVGTAQLQDISVTSSKTEPRFRCRLRNSTPISLTINSVSNVLTWDTEDDDVGPIHSTSTNPSRITIPTGGDVGYWLFIASVKVAYTGVTAGVNDAEWANILLRKNGSVIRDGFAAVFKSSSPSSTSAFAHLQIVSEIHGLVAGDYIEIAVQPQGYGSVPPLTATSNGGGTTDFFEAIHVW